MEAIKVIKPSKKFVNQQFLIGGIMLVGGILAIANGIPYLLGMSILVLGMAFSHQNRKMIQLFEQNMEIKFAPLASAKFIKYGDIIKTEKVSDKKIFVHYKDGSKTTKLRIPVHMIEQDDLSKFLEVVNNKKAA
ncbi:hypothetical protein QUH73_19805 [Labilibaculum sp. K2S]|uniref:hypothetical protein n=1 Tax=Labilibaculum sp. K2S TaxID=3056386 RepID=UPI0025A37C01|nr:hypothetical protein [Labilibaculum sp. K2S]MDM8162073.1 hypothetical protein [Labilibaculum sp. K2S]